MNGTPRFLPEISERIRVPVPTLRQWVLEGKGPRVFKIGRRWAATDADIERWLDQQYARAGGSDAA
jgi:predicted site-specific integrase-resolvase